MWTVWNSVGGWVPAGLRNSRFTTLESSILRIILEALYPHKSSMDFSTFHPMYSPLSQPDTIVMNHCYNNLLLAHQSSFVPSMIPVWNTLPLDAHSYHMFILTLHLFSVTIGYILSLAKMATMHYCINYLRKNRRWQSRGYSLVAGELSYKPITESVSLVWARGWFIQRRSRRVSCIATVCTVLLEISSLYILNTYVDVLDHIYNYYFVHWNPSARDNMWVWKVGWGQQQKKHAIE